MEFPGSLAKHLMTQGILNENTVSEFTQNYYSLKDTMFPEEPHKYENVSVFKLTCFLKNLSADQAKNISFRIFQRWVNNENTPQTQPLDDTLAMELAIKENKNEELEERLNQAMNDIQLLEDECQSYKQLNEQYENQQAQDNHPEVIPLSNSHLESKASSVISILSSRNLRNTNKKSVTPISNRRRMSIAEIDEDNIRDPPIAHNSTKDLGDYKSMTQKIELSRDLSQNSRTPIHERLHDDAKFKKAKLREYELIKKEDQDNECTFKPNLTSSLSRGRSIPKRFEQLYQHDKNAKDEVYKRQRESKEIEGCTFQPNITQISSVKNSTTDGGKNIFSKLYEENEQKKRYRRNLEIEHQSKEVEE